MKKDRIKWLRLLPMLIVLSGLVMIVVYAIKTNEAYKGHHRLEKDKTDNDEILYEPMPGWRKLDLGGYTISAAQFDVIGGNEASFPIFAELKRQCGGNDEKEMNEIMKNHFGGAGKGFLDAFIKSDRGNNIFLRTDCHLFISDNLSEIEKRYAKGDNVELEYEVIGYNDMVFFTHRDNPVDSLTVQQIKDIYSGRITNWKDVGGKDEEITAFQRGNPYTQKAMEKYVMKDSSLMSSKERYIKRKFRENELIENEYLNRTGSIGYTFGYFYKKLYDSEDIKIIKIDGVSPDEDNIRSGAYPFGIPCYAFTVKGDENDVLQVRDFLLSDEGQQVIRMSGYCPARECGD